MIITKSTPFTPDEITRLREQFNTYVKTVIDIDKKICSAGCDRHYDSEQLLLQQGSRQSSLWGGGLDLETMGLDCYSFINIRPSDGNRNNEIQNEAIRRQFLKLMKYFFSLP